MTAVATASTVSALAGRWASDLARRGPAAGGTVDSADRAAAVEAGMLAAARATSAARLDPGGESIACGVDGDVAVGTSAAAAACLSASAVTQGLLDWRQFGLVVPVLGASPGVGASVVATVLADALQLAGRSVLLVDTADAARSGLNRASRTDGPRRPGPHEMVGMRFSWRARAVVARAETSLPVLAAGMVPAPPWWIPSQRRVDVTVVDLAHDPWRVAAQPLTGAGAWLRVGSPSPRPLLVVRPTVPGIAQAEQVVARLEPWARLGLATPATQLVVVGARRWPRPVAAAAGRRVAALLADAVFLPGDRTVALNGVTGAVTPSRLRRPITAMLRRWQVVGPDERPPRRPPPG